MTVVLGNYLEKILGVSIKTIDVYLCRYEFSHIQREVIKKQPNRYYYMTNDDINLLKKLIENRYKNRRVKNGIAATNN